MSVTDDPDAIIPHGLKGYRKPYNCKCDICMQANRDYRNNKRAEAKLAKDELAAKREMRKVQFAQRLGKRTESDDSVPAGARVIGPMESAVIEECEGLEDVKATQLVAAKSLARTLDSLAKESGGHAVVNSTTKQLMALMADIRGDGLKAAKTGRKKSGGRLATVGNLTKVKRTVG